MAKCDNETSTRYNLYYLNVIRTVSFLLSYLPFVDHLYYALVRVHIENADGDAKFEIYPVKLVQNNGIKNKDLRLAESIIEENEDLITLPFF